MATRKRDGSLTATEKPVVKTLLEQGWRNQDIQALLNQGRKATVNSGRITEVKKSKDIDTVSNEAIKQFIARKKAFDPRTGLNSFEDERLVRAREAMIVAVQVFNSPTIIFKTEMFAVQAIIAWTYLLHEYFIRKIGKFADSEGKTWTLSFMLKRDDCPLTQGMKRNLAAIKDIRDAVEHKILSKADSMWLPHFQACCLNFDRKIRELFGDPLSLQGELAFALQFSKLSITQVTEIQNYDIPEHIEALDARLRNGLTEAELTDLDYQFKVIFTLDSASKSSAHFKFVQPESAEAKEISNILVKYSPADETHQHKPTAVCLEVKRRTGKNFTSHNHSQAWQLHKVRPRKGDSCPGKTVIKYCHYSFAHRDYTYSEEWIERLVSEVNDEDTWQKIREYKL